MLAGAVLALLLPAAPRALADGALPLAADRPQRPPGGQPAPESGGPLPALHGRAQDPVFSLDLNDHPAVEKRLQAYLGPQRRYLEQALARMARYRRFVDDSIRERGLPPELLVLPLLESRYLPRAVSSSGAAGLWQLMRNTSGGLGLRSDEWLDERRDFWKSTGAALRKLEQDYRRFGDWYLALAAYNCGAGCLARLLASSGARDFWELRERGLLRAETAEFVPAFIALARIVGCPGRYGLPESWEPSPAWERVPLYRSVDLRLLAGALGLEEELLREANAELRYPLTPAYAQGYALKVPAGLGARVQELLDDPGARLLEYRLHRLASGDTLYGLSRRYGVALSLLEQANHGLDPRRLPVGGVVRVPVVGEEKAGAGGTPLLAAADRPAALSPAAPTSPSTALPATGQAASPPAGLEFSGTWTVEAGDTLWAIARRHGITPELLAAANGRSLDDLLKPGDTLKVP